MNSNRRPIAIPFSPRSKWRIGALLVLLAALIAWAWQWHLNALEDQLKLHQELGEVLADHAARLIGKQGRILTIAAEPNQNAALSSQFDAFTAQLRKLGDYEVREYSLQTNTDHEPPLGTGLSWQEYQRAIKTNGRVDLIVSFAGAPTGPIAATQPAAASHPKFIAECASVNDLPQLFSRKLIDTALLPANPSNGWGSFLTRWIRSIVPMHRAGESHSCSGQRYQIVTAADASSWPKP